ncbi:unnamed protein product, partial [Prunus brigantina]
GFYYFFSFIQLSRRFSSSSPSRPLSLSPFLSVSLSLNSIDKRSSSIRIDSHLRKRPKSLKH